MFSYLIILYLAAVTRAMRTQVCKKQGSNFSDEEVINTQFEENEFQHFIENSHIWVDKSMLIKTILNEKKTILLISAPKKWGKSVNLRMLQSFFQIEEDNQGKRKPVNETFGNKFFQSGVIYREGNCSAKIHPIPLISQVQDITDRYLGQYPVLYICFPAISFDKELKFLHTKLEEACKSYKYVFDQITPHSKMSSNLKKLAHHCIENSSNAMPMDELLYGMKTLSELLYLHYNKKVIILINEYDHFFKNTYFDLKNDFDQEQESSVINFYKKFTEYTFHSNSYLEKAIITTVLPIRSGLGFKGMNNFREYNFTSGDDIYTYFGFTSTEITEIMKLRGIEDNKMRDVVLWYGGYTCPNAPSGQIFFPYSVAGYINYKRKDNFFMVSQYDKFTFQLQKYPEFRNAVVALIDGEFYHIEYNKIPQFDNEHCRLINYFVKSNSSDENDFKKEHIDMALALLYSISFFTADRTFANYGNNGTHIRIKLPNEEVRMEGRCRINYEYEDDLKQSKESEYRY